MSRSWPGSLSWVLAPWPGAMAASHITPATSHTGFLDRQKQTGIKTDLKEVDREEIMKYTLYIDHELLNYRFKYWQKNKYLLTLNTFIHWFYSFVKYVRDFIFVIIYLQRQVFVVLERKFRAFTLRSPLCEKLKVKWIRRLLKK